MSTIEGFHLHTLLGLCSLDEVNPVIDSVSLSSVQMCANSVSSALDVNPRSEDMGVIQQLYQNLVKPYISLNSSWVGCNRNDDK